jgi:hypothetical protein
MPYKSAQEAINKTDSEHFKKFRELERERLRKQILETRTDYLTNPKFNTSLTRDSRGFIVSFEIPELFGKGEIFEDLNNGGVITSEPEFEQVTIDIKEKYFNMKYLEKINRTFEDL